MVMQSHNATGCTLVRSKFKMSEIKSNKVSFKKIETIFTQCRSATEIKAPATMFSYNLMTAKT